MTKQSWTVDIVDWATSAVVLTKLRTEVFIVEQNVSAEEEMDGLDSDAFHFLARDPHGEPAGTARLLPTGQVGRMAVLNLYRNQGVGSALLTFIIEWHRAQTLPPLFLHAQTHAIPFYQRLGFAARGAEFLDAGIAHKEMVMSERVSSSSDLHLLGTLEDFRCHALEMAAHARRSIDILSTTLDFPLYNNGEFKHKLLELARRSRNSQIRVLVKSTQPMVEKGHAVAQLAQRLPSKLAIRKLALEPQDNAMAYLVVDRELLLYKNDDEAYQGFANYSARPEARRLLEEFTYLWEHHSREDPQLRLLTL